MFITIFVALTVAGYGLALAFYCEQEIVKQYIDNKEEIPAPRQLPSITTQSISHVPDVAKPRTSNVVHCSSGCCTWIIEK